MYEILIETILNRKIIIPKNSNDYNLIRMKNSKSVGGDDSYIMMGMSTEIIEDSYSYDAFLDEIGGFGHFQWYASTVMLITFMTGG